MEDLLLLLQIVVVEMIRSCGDGDRYLPRDRRSWEILQVIDMK